MLKSFLISVLFFFVFALNSQNQAKNWFFGIGNGLNFSGPTPTLVSGGAITTSLGCSAISDGAGTLLFYTDGATVYNQNHAVMANGTGLHGIDASQSSLIIKKPLSSSIYYVFTVGGWNTSYGLKYSIVDMTLAAGLGSVTAKNVVLDNTCRDKLSTGKHCNGTDIWIVSTQSVNTFASFSLTSTGVNGFFPAVSSPYNNLKGIGQLKIAPNSRKLAIVTNTSVNFTYVSSWVVLYDFDNSTGLINTANPAILGSYTNPNWPYPKIYGCEFSPNSSQFYFSFGIAGSGSYMYRWDICAPLSGGQVFGSENSVDTISKRSMQLGPDGKIYVAKNGKTNLDYIANPNNTRPLASYFSASLSLGTNTCQWGLPNYPGYYFEQKPFPSFSYTVSPTNCLSSLFTTPDICTATGYSISAYHWNFGDASTGSNNTSLSQSPVHVFSNAGTYSVTLIRSFLCNTNDTIVQLVTVSQPTLTVFNGAGSCVSGSATIAVNGGIGPYTYLWSAGSQTNSSATFLSSGIYSVTVTDAGSGTCVKTTTVNINIVTFSATVNTNNVLCNGQTNGSASVTVLGGSGIYQYTWGAGSSTLSNISSQVAGSYSVYVFDPVYSCSVSSNYTITQPPALAMNLTAPSYSACVNQSIQITANPSGGIAPYNLFWNTSANSNVISSTQALSGNYIYTCTVTDSHSCISTASVQIHYLDYPVLVCSNSSVCKGDTLTLVASGAMNYAWLPPSINSESLILVPTVNSAYTLYGESYGCISSKTVNVVVNPSPNINLTSNSPVCAGQALNLNASGLFIYLWTGPSSFSSSLQNPSITTIATNQGGVYSVSGMDTNSCTATKTVQVIVNALPNPNLTSNSPVCEGQPLNLSTTGFFNCLWTGPSSFSSSWQSPSISNTGTNQAGVYLLTVTSTNSCTVTKSLQVVVNPLPLLNIVGNQTICLKASAQLTVSGANTYLWLNTSSTASIINVAPSSNLNYTVTGTSSITGCSNSATTAVKVIACTGLAENSINSDINVFPNPNSGNFTIEIPVDLEMTIVNTLGQLIFERHLSEGLNAIELLSCEKGIYFIFFKGDETTICKKIVLD